MAQNKRPDADGLAALCFWAGLNPADFVNPEPRSNGAQPMAAKTGPQMTDALPA